MSHADNELNRQVAEALGMKPSGTVDGIPQYMAYPAPFYFGPSEDQQFGDEFEPSSRWDHAGPIIEKYGISIAKFSISATDPLGMSPHWKASCSHWGIYRAMADTAMKAAMIAFVNAYGKAK